MARKTKKNAKRATRPVEVVDPANEPTWPGDEPVAEPEPEALEAAPVVEPESVAEPVKPEEAEVVEVELRGPDFQF